MQVAYLFVLLGNVCCFTKQIIQPTFAQPCNLGCIIFALSVNGNISVRLISTTHPAISITAFIIIAAPGVIGTWPVCKAAVLKYWGSLTEAIGIIPLAFQVLLLWVGNRCNPYFSLLLSSCCCILLLRYFFSGRIFQSLIAAWHVQM